MPIGKIPFDARRNVTLHSTPPYTGQRLSSGTKSKGGVGGRAPETGDAVASHRTRAGRVSYPGPTLRPGGRTGIGRAAPDDSSSRCLVRFGAVRGGTTGEAGRRRVAAAATAGHGRRSGRRRARAVSRSAARRTVGALDVIGGVVSQHPAKRSSSKYPVGVAPILRAVGLSALLLGGYLLLLRF